VARFEVKMPTEFLLKLSQLGNKTDEIVGKVLTAGGEVVAKKVKENLVSMIGKDTKYESRSTGELVSALGVSKPRLDKNGVMNVKIGFSEPRSDGKSNAMIANVLEFGKSGQPPKPFLKPAKSATRNEVIAAMEAAFNEEVSKL
jgi:HK97 gp10 family phage protein